MENDENVHAVIDSTINEETARKARKRIIAISTTTLAVVIMLGAIVYYDYLKKAIAEDDFVYESNQDSITTIAVNDEEVQKTNVEVSEDSNTVDTNSNYNFGGKEVDYSNVESFFNKIVENRNKFGSFAESFQSEEDVRNLVNFFFLFDETYVVETTINSQAMFDEIISDYYKSCVAHDIQPELNTLFKADSLIAKKFKESEALVYNLKNGKGNDYTISNQYYMWLEDNLVNKETAIPEIMKYSPLIDAQREMYQQYKEVGNMNAARRNQKNDYYKVEQRDVYYDHNYGDGVQVNMENHSFSCPDGIDNYVSKTENVEEKKWILSEDGSVPFENVNYYFNYVLNNGKVR